MLKWQQNNNNYIDSPMIPVDHCMNSYEKTSEHEAN